MSAEPELAGRVAQTIADAAGGPVLVLGSLPPNGRDLDILARRPERERLERALIARGYVRKGSTFALFDACSAYGVELIDAEGYLRTNARDELFAAARPLDSLPNLARPAPEHALIIMARLVCDEGRLRPKRIARLRRIVAEDPYVWPRARRVAAGWGDAAKLDLLEREASGAGSQWPRRALARLPARWSRRGMLVSLSGVDGCGKSSQARWLQQAMTALGVPTEVVWNHLGGNFTLDLIRKPARLVFRLARVPYEPLADFEDHGEADEAHPAGPARDIWSSYVTASNSLEQRVQAIRSLVRGRVAVFDRGPLDLAVRMEVIYRGQVERQRRLVELAAPRPGLAFLLDISAELSLQRKHDIWSSRQLREQSMTYRDLAPRFGVRVLDGSRPPAELATEIAQAVWLKAPA